MPFFQPHKYSTTTPVALPDRQWPSRQIQQAPIWLSTDLRDGNQSLFEPMSVSTKRRLFDELVRVGLKEIEVGFPAASQTDFDFVRSLIEQQAVPSNVTLMVMCQMREDLIRRTVEAVHGAPRVIVHLYNATAPVWRDTVFQLSVSGVMGLIEQHVGLLKTLTDACPGTQWVLQYSPETFNATELPVALQACHTAMAAWQVSAQRPVIINLPTTVENATPNVFADQIEWMDRHLQPREHIILSVHTHNDRGTGVAAAELAQLAGAQRVEGCLFGNGERSGNVDLVTVALNLHTQGIDCGLDFSQIDRTAGIISDCTGLPIHPRHPYVGELVHTAFSGSHQDAIRKGFAAQQPDQPWQVPYLPIDPADLGRSYQDVIRVNSQSGKGGMAFLLEQQLGVRLPRRLQLEFSKIVQAELDLSGQEIRAEALWTLFQQHYVNQGGYEQHTSQQHTQSASSNQSHFTDSTKNSPSSRSPSNQSPMSGSSESTVEVQLQIHGVEKHGTGNGILSAVAAALGGVGQIVHFEETSLGHGTDGLAFALIEWQDKAGKRHFGAGLATDSTTAAIQALVGASRAVQDRTDHSSRLHERVDTHRAEAIC